VLYPEKAGIAVVDEAEVERRYSIPGRAYAEMAILRGDPSDGLPGLAGFGPKKAADLVRKYGSVRAMIDAGLFREADAVTKAEFGGQFLIALALGTVSDQYQLKPGFTHFK